MAKILVIDDSITMAKYVEMVLSAQGHSLTIAGDGNEAISILNNEDFDLIFMDVVMPGKSGYQLCREIKNTEQLKDIPVVMLTTKNNPSDKFWGMRQGANEYLTKPCTPESLLSAVDKFTGGKGARNETSPNQSDANEKRNNPLHRFDA